MKKMIKPIIMIIIFIIMMVTGEKYTLAAPISTSVSMGIIPLMNDEIGYAITDTNSDSRRAQIWNIIKYKSSTSSEYDDENIYCIKAKIGFTGGSYQRANYNIYYDMKTESRENIKNIKGDVLKPVVEGNIEGSNRYSALLAVMDMLYLPGESTQEEKEKLINEVIDYAIDNFPDDKYIDILADNPMEDPLTDEDINAVQQAVIWYFTNYEDESFDKTDVSLWFLYTQDGNNYSSFQSYRPVRGMQVKWLYHYMIDKAKEKAHLYDQGILTGSPIRIDTTNEQLESEISGENCIIGPIHMTSLRVVPYEVELTVKNNGTNITNYKLLNENKQETRQTIKDLVGRNFYISIPKAQLDTITISTKVDYHDKQLKLYASTTKTEQPLVEAHKTNRQDIMELTKKVEEPKKEFDLALRKYITKINGQNVGTSRVPVIDATKLNTQDSSGNKITTASYVHTKDPVTVKIQDKVTYQLTIYNEGEKAGRATKVVDQLPTGLTFNQVKSGNFEIESYEENTNRLILRRKAGNTTNLNQFNGGKPAEETIEIECTVTGNPNIRKQ